VFEANKAAGHTNPAKNLRQTSLDPPSTQRIKEIQKHSAEARKRIEAASLEFSRDLQNSVADWLTVIQPKAPSVNLHKVLKDIGREMKVALKPK
jgi:hypothetical protein